MPTYSAQPPRKRASAANGKNLRRWETDAGLVPRLGRWTPFVFRLLAYTSQECATTYVCTRGLPMRTKSGMKSWIGRTRSRLGRGAVDGPLGWARGLQLYVQLLGKYTALESVLGMSYFTRSWIMQEVALSRVVLVMCGGSNADWDPDITAHDDMSLGLRRNFLRLHQECHNGQLKIGCLVYEPRHVVQKIFS